MPHHEELAAIVRLWATETHVLPATPKGTTQAIKTPPLYSAPKQKTAPQLAFNWSVPQAGPPIVTNIRLVSDSGVEQPVDNPLMLLTLLQSVAAFRAGNQPPPTAELSSLMDSHEKTLDLISQTITATGEPSLVTDFKWVDGAPDGQPTGLWLTAPSFFFPALTGIDQQPESPGMMWLNTAGFGGPVAPVPTLSLAECDFPDRVTASNRLPGFSVRNAAESDATHIAAWMSLPHLVFSFRQPWSTHRWATELHTLSEQPHTRPLVLCHDTTPIGYLELYRPVAMSIGSARPTDPRTIGIHIAIADPKHIGGGVGRHIVTLFAESIIAGDPSLFSHGLGEPDVLNTAARGAAQSTGGKEVAELVFPHKCAALISSEPIITSSRKYHV